MLWVKSFHIVFVVSWFAGLFYLPRIFVNIAMVPQPGPERDRLLLMSWKLYRFVTPIAWLALGFGTWLWLGYGIGKGPDNAWMHAKLAAVAGLVAYHYACGRMLRSLQAGTNARSHVWFRFFNEVPVLGLVACVVLVVLKPF